MKSKFSRFIIKIITILVISILIFFMMMLYDEFRNKDITKEVENFVNNISSLVEENSSTEEIEKTQENKENDSIKDNYFFNQLEDYAKIIYKKIDDNVENMKQGTYVLNFDNDFNELLLDENGEDLIGKYYQSAIEAYAYDNPQIFYIDYSKLCLNKEITTRLKKKTVKIFINQGNNLNYLDDEFSSKEDVDLAIEKIEKIKLYFIQNKKQDNYSNIKLVHDYLVDSIEYEETISKSNIYNIYGALIEKECVCEGYAKAFKYLMDALQIPCVLVSGQATNSEGVTENHEWNYVLLNNNWYFVDCTWDDPIIIGTGILDYTSKYKYFLKGENFLNKTHKTNGQFTTNGKIFKYPTLNKNNY